MMGRGPIRLQFWICHSPSAGCCQVVKPGDCYCWCMSIGFAWRCSRVLLAMQLCIIPRTSNQGVTPWLGVGTIQRSLYCRQARSSWTSDRSGATAASRPLPPLVAASSSSRYGFQHDSPSAAAASQAAYASTRGLMVSALSTSRSSSITEPDLERLADLCRRLEAEDAEESGRAPLQIDAASEARALRLLLEEADLSLGELEQLVVRLRGEPLSRAFLNAAGSGWSGVNLLPSLRAEVGMSRRQVAEAVLKYPDLLCTYTSDAATTVRRLRWHLCTDWETKQELPGEDSLAAALVREPRLLTLERDALKVKIHDLLRLIVTPNGRVPEDPIAGLSRGVSWERHYCGMLQPALRRHPRALVGRGLKNMRRRVSWLAENLEMQERATAAGAMLLVLAAGLDVQAIESRVKMLRQTTGLGSTAGLREFLLETPTVLLADAKSVEATARVLAGRCPSPALAQEALRRLLREHGPNCLEHAATIEI